MATFLYRLGRGSMRRRRLVVALWLVVLVGLGLAAATLSGPTANNFTMPGTESQRAQDLLAEQFPTASGATGTIAVKAPAAGQLGTPEGQAVVKGITQEAATLPGVVGAVGPLHRPSRHPRRPVRADPGPVHRGPRRGHRRAANRVREGRRGGRGAGLAGGPRR